VALWRGARDGVEAWNRRDLDAFLIAYHADCEHYPPREFVEAGLWEPRYRGREGYAKLMQDLYVRLLLARVRDERYPNPEDLDRIETALQSSLGPMSHGCCKAAIAPLQ
jgi:hypothetical protein